MVNCAVKVCKSRSSNVKKENDNEKIAFHEFPVNMGLRERWILFIGIDNWLPTEWSRVCSLHFKPDDYEEGKKIRKLKKTAVPSIFPEQPEKCRSQKSRKRVGLSKAEPCPIPKVEDLQDDHLLLVDTTSEAHIGEPMCIISDIHSVGQCVEVGTCTPSKPKRERQTKPKAKLKVQKCKVNSEMQNVESSSHLKNISLVDRLEKENKDLKQQLNDKTYEQFQTELKESFDISLQPCITQLLKVYDDSRKNKPLAKTLFLQLMNYSSPDDVGS